MPKQLGGVRGVLLLVLGVILAGCSSSPAPDEPAVEGTPRPGFQVPAVTTDGAWVVSRCSWAPSSALSAPDVVAAFRPNDSTGAPVEGRIERLVFRNGSYEAAASAPLGFGSDGTIPVPQARVAVLGEHVFALDIGKEGALRIVRFDRSMTETASVAFDAFGSMVVHGGVLFVAAETLRAYDANLTLLGQVELPLKEGPSGKLAHDVLVHEGVAYLLDDVIMPLYILRVDVRDPADMLVLERNALLGGHLMGHWIDPDHNKWMVLETMSSWGGAWQDLHVYPTSVGERVTTLRVENSTGGSSGPLASQAGRTIVAVDRVGDLTWVLAASAANMTLGTLQVGLEGGRFYYCEHELQPLEGWPTALTHDERFLAGFSGSRIFVVDLGGPIASLVHEEDTGRALRAIGLWPATPEGGNT